MRTDLLSKRFFFLGLAGLPWLWIVHVLYWRGNPSEENEGILNPDDHFQDNPSDASPEEIKRQAERWVTRCKYAAAMVVTAWIGWIVAVQVLRGTLPSSLYMLNANDEKLTGW